MQMETRLFFLPHWQIICKIRKIHLKDFVTGMTRRETCGSKCKLFIIKHGQYRQGRAVANRYGMGKTQE